jgi:hypothetical protein
VTLHEFAERLSRQERNIAGQEDQRSLTAREIGFGLLKCMGCPELWLLKSEGNIRSFNHCCSHGIGAVPDNNGNTRWLNSFSGLKDVLEQRLPYNLMQNFWKPGFHARPLTGRENDDVDFRSHHLYQTTNFLARSIAA